MNLRRWPQTLQRAFNRRKPQTRRRARVAPWKPRLEPLESRLAPATITVTTNADDTSVDGTVSLREAITSIDNGANLNADVAATGTYGTNDTILFNLPGVGGVIQPTSQLPFLTTPMIIDGYSQPGSSPNTLANGDNAVPTIQLNGDLVGLADGLVITGGNSLVRGLVINRFLGHGIAVFGTGGNTIQGNFIGTNRQGTFALPNGDDGILIRSSSNNVIGGDTPAERNIISGNGTDGADGIEIKGSLGAPASGNFVLGNFVGVNAAGTGPVGLRTEGSHAGTSDGNFGRGIHVIGGTDNVIGGLTAGARNVVGFNLEGIDLDDGASNNSVLGNFVGVGADGVTPVGNIRHGIVLRSRGAGSGQANEPGVSDNLIGGRAPGAGNTIEFNGAAGVAVFGDPLSISGNQNINNEINGNSIYLNGRSNPSSLLGIDLVTQSAFPNDDGITPNHLGGRIAGPNFLQNFPVLTAAVPASGGGTTITGTLNSGASGTFRIEFFSDATASGSGQGEGQTFLGFLNVNTDAKGKASFSTTVPTTVPAGQFVSATATDSGLNTSEFAADVEVPFPVPTTASISPNAAGEGSGPLTITVTGANFFNGSTVEVNGTPAATTFVSNTQLTAQVPAANLADEASLSITVTNPAPTGGASNAQTFTVQEALLPGGFRGTANQRFVSEVYRDLLGRAVDPSGLITFSGLLDQGSTRGQVINLIEASPEYRGDQVQAAYTLYLHRLVDPLGLTNDVSFLNAGGTVEQLAVIVVGSGEYFQNRAAGTNDGFLDALYADVLHRAVDPAGRTGFDHAFAAGATRAQVAAAIFASPEYQQDLVQSYFNQFLDRGADSAGLSAFATALQQGARDEAVIAAILASGEFFNKTAP